MATTFRRLAITAPTAILAAFLHSAPAAAVENFLPYLAGLTVGVPIGMLPSQGLYFADDLDLVDGTIRNGGGHGIANITAAVDLPQLLYNPGIEILGAKYAFLIVTPLSTVGIQSPLGKENATGVFNPYIAPLNLSWALSKQLFVSASFGVYLPMGTYDSTAPLNIANNFTTFEPALGVTYLKDGWDLSASLRSDFNTEDTANQYHSGDILSVDYSVTKAFGDWKAGVGGYTVDQFTDDTIDGVNMPASPSNGLGRTVLKSSLGPIIGYNFGKASVQVSYLHDFVGKNYGGGDNVFLRLTMALQ